jgi:hypothetical protein
MDCRVKPGNDGVDGVARIAQAGDDWIFRLPPARMTTGVR